MSEELVLSVVVLAVLGVVVLGVTAWRRRSRPLAYAAVGAAVLVLGSPFVL